MWGSCEAVPYRYWYYYYADDGFGNLVMPTHGYALNHARNFMQTEDEYH